MTDWNKAKVVDLKAELKKRGLPQTGLKPALVARLTAAENEDGAESEATVQGEPLKIGASAATSPDTASPTQGQSAENILEPASQTTPESNSVPSEQPGAVRGEAVEGAVPDAQIVPLSTQSSKTRETSQPTVQAGPERSTLLSVEPQEAIVDRQKRKRRSQSPPISSPDALRKRARKSDEAGVENIEIATPKSESDRSGKHNAMDEVEIIATSRKSADVVEEDNRDEDKMEVEMQSNLEAIPAPEISEDALSRTRDSRFKDLFNSPSSGPAMGVHMEKSEARDFPSDEPEPERNISPAIHPATAALYIRDFMRPLNASQLKAHLSTLATPPGRDIDVNTVIDFYLDPIRTHAFVSFTNVSAASRVRSALHGRIWPDERNRKPLWVDFIPSDVVREWTDLEETSNSAGRGSAKKWEVHYEFDEEHIVMASLQEASNIPMLQQSRKSSVQVAQTVPLQPPLAVVHRGIEGAPSGPRAEQVRESSRGNGTATNTTTLDQLFKPTTAKPVLYWLPVSKELIDRRLDALEDATSKHYRKNDRADDDINRFTFQDGHILVDRGPELFGGIRPPPGFRGPQFGTTRVPIRRGGYVVGGTRGDRMYDSYRGGGGGGTDRRGFRDDRIDDRDGRRGFRDDRRY